MTADLSGPVGAADPRIELQRHPYPDDYAEEDPDYPKLLALARREPTHAWYAAAYTARTRRFAGRAWSFYVGYRIGKPARGDVQPALPGDVNRPR